MPTEKLKEYKDPNMTGNFDRLEDRYPQLACYAKQAEEYAHTDPQSALLKLNCFSEILVCIIYKDLKLPCKLGASMFDKLSSGIFVDVVGLEVCQKLQALRMKGNLVNYQDRATSEMVLWLIKEAYLLGQWLYKIQCDASVGAYPEFKVPPQPITIEPCTKTDVEMMEQQDVFKDELDEIIFDGQEALIEMAHLGMDMESEKIRSFKLQALSVAESIDFDQEVTLKNLSLHDSFLGYELTGGQQELVEELDRFLSSDDTSVFQLKGYAGVGKTFITKGLTEYFRSIGRTFLLAAPTGKAAKVISTKTQYPAYTIHKSIYAFKHLTERPSQDGNDEPEEYNVLASVAQNQLPDDTVYIVDEASMISNASIGGDGFFRCGSSKLLNDFFDYVGIASNENQKKIIFIGDNAQLPPIGMSHSPALCSDYLLTEFGVKTHRYELTEVVRQKSDSGVMRNASELRKALNKKVYHLPTLEADTPDIEKVSCVDFMPKYLSACSGYINDKSIVITGSNREALEYNKRIREHFYPGNPCIAGGDTVIAVSNSDRYGFFISNGEFGRVLNVWGEPEVRKVTVYSKSEERYVDIDLCFRNVEVRFNDFDERSRIFSASILESLLYSEKPQLTTEENRALYKDFCMRNEHLRPNSPEFNEALRGDRYFNALRVKFGYAITCHKAQGSEWEHVFVKYDTYQNPRTEGYYRWLYTAITRTSKQLYLLDSSW